LQKVPEIISVISFVGDQTTWGDGCRKQRPATMDICHLTAREEQGIKAASLVDQSMKFGGQPAA
jgi:hypothetical protein